jgi:hypothetical protein
VCLIVKLNGGDSKQPLDTAEQRRIWFEQSLELLFETENQLYAFMGDQLSNDYVDILKTKTKNKDVTIKIIDPESG